MANIQGLEFFQYNTKKGHSGKRKDVLISKWSNSNKGQKDRLAVAFYNGIEELVLDEEHVMLTIATWKDRLYIVPTNNGQLLGNSKSNARTMSFPVADDNEAIFDWCGDYELKYDKARELYYVERGTSE